MPTRETHAGGRVALRTALAAAMLAGIVPTLPGCRCEEQPDARGPMPRVRVATASERPLYSSYEFVGRTEASEITELVSEIDGTVARVVPEGARVQQDAAVVVVDVSAAEAALEQVTEDLEEARAALDAQLEELRTARSELDSGELGEAQYRDIEAAEAELRREVVELEKAAERARREQRDAEIRAPVTGRVFALEVGEGSWVAAGQSVALIRRLDPIDVRFEIPSPAYAELGQVPAASGAGLQALRVRRSDGRWHPEGGGLEELAKKPGSETMVARARFDNQRGFLDADRPVRVVVPAPEAPMVLTVPEAAIEGRAQVRVVDEQGRIEIRTVSLGESLGSDRIITDGLVPGERVVVEGGEGLAPGSAVEVLSDLTAARRSGAGPS